jgi:hypothetical protein
MCPGCLTTLALIAVGTGSAGGLATSVLLKLRGTPAGKALVRTLSAGDAGKNGGSR